MSWPVKSTHNDIFTNIVKILWMFLYNTKKNNLYDLYKSWWWTFQSDIIWHAICTASYNLWTYFVQLCLYNAHCIGCQGHGRVSIAKTAGGIYCHWQTETVDSTTGCVSPLILINIEMIDTNCTTLCHIRYNDNLYYTHSICIESLHIK